MPDLRRELDLTGALSLGIGGTIGGGIFVLIGAAAGLAGPGVLLSFIIAFAASLSIALPYAELSSRYPQAGGGYIFTHSIFGPRWGFFMGWGYWGAYLFISGYVTLGFGGYLHALTGLPVAFGAVGLVALCILLNLAGVKISGKAQTMIIALAILSLVIFSLIGLPRVSETNLAPFVPSGLSGVLVATPMCFLAFGGFDIVASVGDEVKNPQRNLPYAIVLTLCSVLGLYLLVAYVAVGILPWRDLAASNAPLTLAATNSIGPSFGPAFVALAALLTTAATCNAVLVVDSRVMFAMSREGVLPRLLSSVNKSSGVPWASVICTGGVLGLVGAFGSVTLLTAIGGFLYVVHFMFPLAALVKLRRNERKPIGKNESTFFRTPVLYLVIPFAMALSGVLLIATAETGFLFGTFWLGVGALLSAISSRHSRELSRHSWCKCS